MASAESTAVASQGDVIPKESVRLRFEVSFPDAENDGERASAFALSSRPT